MITISLTLLALVAPTAGALVEADTLRLTAPRGVGEASVQRLPNGLVRIETILGNSGEQPVIAPQVAISLVSPAGIVRQTVVVPVDGEIAPGQELYFRLVRSFPSLGPEDRLALSPVAARAAEEGEAGAIDRVTAAQSDPVIPPDDGTLVDCTEYCEDRETSCTSTCSEGASCGVSSFSCSCSQESTSYTCTCNTTCPTNL